jgi:hypothetical protein
MQFMTSNLVFAAQCLSRLLLTIVTVSLLLYLCSELANAAPIFHGDHVGTGVTYEDVTEDSGTDPSPPGSPLFGTPTVGGNSLNFNPVGFDATSANGAAADITDGQLTFMISVNNKNAQHMTGFRWSEVGDTTLAGNVPANSTVTSTSALITPVVQIVEVDGVGITPITLTGMSTPPLPSLAANFTQLPGNTPTDATWFLGVDGGGGPMFATQWAGVLDVDLEDALIKSGRPFSRGVTKVSVNVNNVLAATSEAGTNATIAKKDTLIITTDVIPEPAAISLALLALAGGLMVRRAR